ncbi:hypothetical protein BOX15_Mlig000667g4 [Macrostomum lignano]|uniref:O-acyltransferase n=1 Tax=Macrostomum lignano TaxID=282301 RepID=A0A267F783_9PLAT|nr:hypothetical protein BOX15_Mlig000667g4 [Macrostomum lignano]
MHRSSLENARRSNGSLNVLEDARRRRKFLHDKQSILELLDSQLTGLIDRASTELETSLVDAPASSETARMTSLDSLAALDANISYQAKNNRQGKNDDNLSVEQRLPPKTFHLRNSLLTELFELAHFRSLQNIFIAIMSLFCLNTLISDVLEGKSLIDTFSLSLVFWAFGRLSDAIAIWLLMHAAALLVFYPAFHYYVSIAGTKGHSRISKSMWMIAYSVYQLWFLVQPIRMVLQFELLPASALIVLTEQARLMMKVHAFLWENARRGYYSSTGSCSATASDSSSSTASLTPRCPSFGRFLYFLFAPTLVYRDNYPRTDHIRWNYVASNLGQVVAGIFFVYLLVLRYYRPVFSHWRRPSLAHFVRTAFQSALPGGLVLLITFFTVLHSWMNAFAEMLTFGDRQFYCDWWNATSFRTWYRTWNTVVHDWLYAYVYREICMLLGYEYRLLATVCVFLLSAIFHEIVISFGLGFFFPALFVSFCSFGFALMFANGRSRFWAVFVWVCLFLGTGVLMCLYSMEWYARRNCPTKYADRPLLDFLIPRSFTCVV